MNFKEIILKELETMAKKESIVKNIFKVRAYNKVISQIKNLKKVESMNDLQNISGIGEKIRDKLIEIFSTGSLQAAEKARTIKTQTGINEIALYDELMSIHGIGSVKARELIEQNNVVSIEDLKQKVILDPSLLNNIQKIGLNYYYDIIEKIPRNEINKHLEKLIELLQPLDRNIYIKIVGSYRRWSETSSDIDVLITIDKPTIENFRQNLLSKVIDELKKHNYLVADLSVGKSKYLGICKLNNESKARRIDILVTSHDEYPFALLYFTGDFNINIALRKQANEMDYTLNEYGLIKRTGEKVELHSERELFAFLGFKYLLPKDRNINNLKKI